MARKFSTILLMLLINNTGFSLSFECGNKWFGMVNCPSFFPGYNTSFINMTVNTIYNCLYQAKNKPTAKSLVFHKDSQTGQNTCFLYEDIASSCDDNVEGDFGSNRYLFKPNKCENGGSLTDDKLKCDCPNGYLGSSCTELATDCKDLNDRGTRQRGKYFVKLLPNQPPINLTCFYGNTVVMYQDINYDVNFTFNRSWAEYRDGFYGQENFWLGLDIMNFLTTERFLNKLVITANIVDSADMEQYLQTTFSGFKVGNESTEFLMTYRDISYVSNYLGELLRSLNNSRFSTYDNDNDNRPLHNCAVKYGGGWWYNTAGTFSRGPGKRGFTYNCAPANPTGYFWNQCESCISEVKDISTGNVVNGVVHKVEMYLY